MIKKGHSVGAVELKRFIQYSIYDFIIKEIDMNRPIKFCLPNGQVVNFIIRVG